MKRMLTPPGGDLSANEKRKRAVADFTYNWEYWVDPEGRFVYISPSCERVTGYPPKAFVESPEKLKEIIHLEDHDVFARHLRRDSLISGGCHIDFRIFRRDRETRWISHCCQEVRGADGAYLGRRCSNRDITYQKEIEEDLFNKTIDLEKTNAAVKALLDQRDVEKRSIEQAMVVNLKRFVFPYLDDIEQQKSGRNATLIKIIRTNIEQLVSPVSQNLIGAYSDFTPTEIKVADLIRQGASTKKIAGILNASAGTIAVHRNRIRKKLNILNKKINLQTYLNSLP